MPEAENTKQYDLEDPPASPERERWRAGRTLEFARRVRAFVKELPKTLANIEDGKQLINSSGSVGANYIEANEALSKKDFIMRIKISRKEAKESRYWLSLIDTHDESGRKKEQEYLVRESTELMNILGSILRKTE